MKYFYRLLLLLPIILFGGMYFVWVMAIGKEPKCKSADSFFEFAGEKCDFD